MKKEKENTIKLSEKYGVNPSLVQCIVCSKDTGEIVLFGRDYKDKSGNEIEAPKHVITGALCSECEKKVAEGNVFILEVTNDSTENNIEKTGRYVTGKKEKIFKNSGKYAAISFMKECEFKKLEEEECSK